MENDLSLTASSEGRYGVRCSTDINEFILSRPTVRVTISLCWTFLRMMG